MAYGTALASFNVEEFGTERMERLTAAEIDARVEDLRRDHAVRAFAGASRDIVNGVRRRCCAC